MHFFNNIERVHKRPASSHFTRRFISLFQTMPPPFYFYLPFNSRCTTNWWMAFRAKKVCLLASRKSNRIFSFDSPFHCEQGANSRNDDKESGCYLWYFIENIASFKLVKISISSKFFLRRSGFVPFRTFHTKDYEMLSKRISPSAPFYWIEFQNFSTFW